MSMSEALRAAGWPVDTTSPLDEIRPRPVVTPLDATRELLTLANAGGLIDATSPTWVAVAKWAAVQILNAQEWLEHPGSEENTAALRSRIATLRELLQIHREERTPKVVPDFNPAP